MSLATGTRLGPYEIGAPLGAGGMGEVYRALDTRLGRSVAIKSLPPAYVGDPGRLARFEREAKLLAALNHPNIAGIHGLEDVDGTPYLVLEFVDGETLGARLARGPLTARETLEICGQIASAIEAAHERSIVHRDLKPGNVMLTATSTVKVLDFGLAKGSEGESGSSAALSMTPTVGLSATGDGIILGTAPYMSPEQARGKAVDRRTDVWAFGCVLFECLTGRPAFAGETVSDVIARILEREPEWNAIPASTPVRLREVVRRCLTKDAAERPRDIGDLRLELSAIAQELSSPASAPSRGSDVPSLAVLYFENLASDKESEYFCAGITEDILTDLSKIKGLRVASRNAVARYRGSAVDIPRVASDLGVKAVLEGSVRRAGDRVRISAQLINAADGFHLWAERYDRTLEDVFAVQEEIASSIAEALRVALSPAESKGLVHDRPKDVRAYDLYLKGRERYSRYRVEEFGEALALFQQATVVDAGYALAWAGIADCYGQLMQWDAGADIQELARLGHEAAARALAINPRLPEAFKARSLVLKFSGDPEGGYGELLKAIEVNPRFTPALINLAVHAICNGDVAGTERFLRRTLEIDPQEAFAVGWMTVLLRVTSRPEESIASCLRLRKISDARKYVGWSHAVRVWVHLGQNDLDAAEQAVRDAVADGCEPLRSLDAAITARRGRLEDARHIVLELEHQPFDGAIDLFALADAAIRVGELERAARILAVRLVADLTPTVVRLCPELHALLDRAPLAPRRRDVALVWPLEAPMIDAARHALFREVRIESGLPQGSDIRPR